MDILKKMAKDAFEILGMPGLPPHAATHESLAHASNQETDIACFIDKSLFNQQSSYFLK
jgi:hypothetical protein